MIKILEGTTSSPDDKVDDETSGQEEVKQNLKAKSSEQKFEALQ